MKISLFHRIMALLFCAVLVTGIGGFLVAKHFMDNGFNALNEKNLYTFYTIIEEKIRDTQNAYANYGRIIALDPAVIAAVKEKNSGILQKLSQNYLKNSEAEILTISDNEGNVIARGHSDKIGDSVLGQENVQQGLKGQPTSGIEEGSVVKFSIRSGTPIVLDGKVLGVVTIGESLNNDFVDNLSKLTSYDVTIFSGDTRFATTLIKDGKRAVGTKVNDKRVINSVLQEGKPIILQLVLFGHDYMSLYAPLRNSSGKIAGMLYFGEKLSIVEQAQKNVAYMSFIASTAIVITMMLIGFLFSRSLVIPLRKCIDFAEDIAAGNLQHELAIHRKDEIGTLANALRKMAIELQNILSKAHNSAKLAEEKAEQAEQAMKKAEAAAEMAHNAKKEGMLSAAAQLEGVVASIALASEELSSQISQSTISSHESSQHITDAATAMNEMNSTVQEVARSAAETAATSIGAKTQAEDGARIAAKAVQSISKVQGASEILKNNMTQLNSHAMEISRVIGVITDIADQTNLLALNAAIEAARAGEAGRGFAVVADEVRKLAEKTMGSTQDVSDAVIAIQKSAEDSFCAMGNALAEVEISIQYVNKSGEALGYIVKNVDSMAGEVHAIATASEEQSAASEEINRSISMINGMASQTAQAMQEAEKAIITLTQQAHQLSEIINKLRQS